MAGENVFERVVCAVDGTPASAEAARQAALLLPEGGTLRLATVLGEAELRGEWGRGFTLSPGDWHGRLEPAVEALPPGVQATSTPVFDSGPPADALVRELRESRATLVAVGSHGRRRLPGLVLGSVAVRVLRDAPCSVLVARGERRRFRRLAAGVDGSPAAERALTLAESLAGRLGADLELVENADAPVDALKAAVCDLLVLGSRGLEGLRALGSVSERVAHDADASVLVVR